MLRLIDADARHVDAIVSGSLDDAVIPDDLRVLAELARDITLHAHRITDDHFDRARAHGWTNGQILEAAWVACLFNGIVRLADTLGLSYVGQLEEDTENAAIDDEATVASPGPRPAR